MRRLRVAAPLVASAALLMTLGVCLTLTLAQKRYVGGLTLPYFSDMGRDRPSYFVFGIGLSIVALAILLTWVLNLHYQLGSLRLAHRRLASKWVLCWSVLAALLGVLSTPALPLLSFCSTSTCPNVHMYATYWFFALETLAIVINTCVMYKLLRVVTRAAIDGDDTCEQTRKSLRATVTLQAATAALLVATALLFVGMGIALYSPTTRLSVQDCLSKHLGTTYCTQTMRASGDQTKLWNYETHFGLHQARAVCEWVAMLSLVGYSLSFLLYRDHDLDRRARPMDVHLLAV